MDQLDDKLAPGTSDEKRASKIPRGHQYMHRKASRKRITLRDGTG